MKGLLAVFFVAAFTNSGCLADMQRACVITTGNGQPGCRLADEFNVLWQNNWDFTTFWRCVEDTKTAEAVKCPDNTLFHFDQQECVEATEWQWTQPCAPLSEPETEAVIVLNSSPAVDIQSLLPNKPNVVLPYVCVPTVGDGQPGCFTAGEMQQFYPNFWDYTRFWVCIEADRPGVSVNCPPGCLFDQVLQDCIFPDSWVRPESCLPPSTPLCRETCWNCEDNCNEVTVTPPTPTPPTLPPPTPSPDTPDTPTPPTPSPDTPTPPTPPPPTQTPPIVDDTTVGPPGATSDDCETPDACPTDGRPCCSTTGDFLQYWSNFWRPAYYWVCVAYRGPHLVRCPDNCLFSESLQECVDQSLWVAPASCDRTCVDPCPGCDDEVECVDSTHSSGEPGCSVTTEINVKIRNNWDPSGYWYCTALGAVAEMRNCDPNTLFDEATAECVAWYRWVWTCPTRETTAVTTTTVEVPTTTCELVRGGNGRPGCQLPSEVGQNWRNHWDNTRYWVCNAVGSPAVEVICPTNFLFLGSAGVCVPVGEWIWECPFDPPSFHSDCPNGVCVSQALPEATTPKGWTGSK